MFRFWFSWSWCFSVLTVFKGNNCETDWMKSSLRQDHNGMSELLRVLRFHLILTVRTEDPRWQRQRIKVNWKYMFALLALLHGYPISFNLYIVLNSMCMTKLSRTKTELVGTAWDREWKIYSYVLTFSRKPLFCRGRRRNTAPKFITPHAEPCFVHFKHLIVLWRSRCHRSRICLNSLLVFILETANFAGNDTFLVSLLDKLTCGKFYLLLSDYWKAK